MSKSKVIRAWKDASYRNTLSEEERASLPAHPAGSIELSEADLGNVAGGRIRLSNVGGGRCTLECTYQDCPTYFIMCLTLTIC